MDRINKFLQNRQVKNKRVLLYKNKRIEITKDDLKKIRAYRKGVNLGGPLSNGKMNLEKKESDKLELERIVNINIAMDNEVDSLRKTLNDERIRKRFLKKNPMSNKQKNIKISKNVIYDIYEDETVETLKSYDQEWIYSIKSQYSGNVDDLCTDNAYELKRVYERQFTPREKTISTKSIIEKKCLNYDFEVSKEFGIAADKIWRNICRSVSQDNDSKPGSMTTSHCLDSTSTHNIDSTPYTYFDFNYAFLSNSIDNIYNPLLFFSSEKILYYKSNPLIVSTLPIKHFYISGHILGLLFRNKVEIYEVNEISDGINKITYDTGAATVLDEQKNINMLSTNLLSTYKVKTDILTKLFLHKNVDANVPELDHKASQSSHSFTVSTSNGITRVVDGKTVAIKSLNYIVDFVCLDEFIFAVNNLNRIFVTGDKTYEIMHNEIGKKIAVFRVGNPQFAPFVEYLIAVLFSNEIVIYSFKTELDKSIDNSKLNRKSNRDSTVQGSNQIIPCFSTPGRYKTISWDKTMPYLYVGDKSKVYMYS